MIIDCKHNFDIDCLKTALKDRKTCPSCDIPINFHRPPRLGREKELE